MSTINADYSALRKYYKILSEYELSLRKLPQSIRFPNIRFPDPRIIISDFKKEPIFQRWNTKTVLQSRLPPHFAEGKEIEELIEQALSYDKLH